MSRKQTYQIELDEILEVIQKFQKRIDFIKSKGKPVDPKLQAALDQLKTDVTTLAAQNGGASTQAVIDAVNAIDAIAKGAITPAPPTPPVAA